MLRLLADEDFDGRIVRGIFYRKIGVDLVRVQDQGLSGASDPEVLRWTAENGRILLTHDKRTMPRHVRDRIVEGLHVPGVFIVDSSASIGECIDDIQLIGRCSEQDEWIGNIIYLPFLKNP